MEHKTIKFRTHLADMVLKGEKNVTWRLFDDKELKEGDIADLINWDTKERFAQAELVKVYEKTLGTLEDQDWEGHEKFKSEQEMYEIYKTYYGDKVNKDTVVKIIQFNLI